MFNDFYKEFELGGIGFLNVFKFGPYKKIDLFSSSTTYYRIMRAHVARFGSARMFSTASSWSTNFFVGINDTLFAN